MVLSLLEKLVYNTGSQKGAEDEKEKLLDFSRFDGDFYFFQFRCFRLNVQWHELNGQRVGAAGLKHGRGSLTTSNEFILISSLHIRLFLSFLCQLFCFYM